MARESGVRTWNFQNDRMVQIIMKESKMKVLTFVPMPPSVTGGVEEYAYSVISEMRRQGLDVKVVAPKFKNDLGVNSVKDEGYLYIPSALLFKRAVPIQPIAFI